MNEEEAIAGVNQDEMLLRQQFVKADINRYISKKYPNLKDAVIVERPAEGCYQGQESCSWSGVRRDWNDVEAQ